MKKLTIIIVMFFLLIYIGLSGCFEFQNNEESENVKIIEISGKGVTQTVNYVEKPVKLVVSGMDCNITVSNETNLTEIIVSGMNSIVRVSKNHSFISTVSGMDAEIIYYD